MHDRSIASASRWDAEAMLLSCPCVPSRTGITGMVPVVSPKRSFLYHHGDGRTLSVVGWISRRLAMLLTSGVVQLEKAD